MGVHDPLYVPQWTRDVVAARDAPRLRVYWAWSGALASPLRGDAWALVPIARLGPAHPFGGGPHVPVSQETGDDIDPAAPARTGERPHAPGGGGPLRPCRNHPGERRRAFRESARACRAHPLRDQSVGRLYRERALPFAHASPGDGRPVGAARLLDGRRLHRRGV